MLPVHVTLHHYRALRDCSIALQDYTALVGPNGVGKSTVLQALNFFMDPTRSASAEDFHHEYPAENVAVSVTFDELTEEERAEHGRFLDNRGRLIVTKLATPDGSSTYRVKGKQHPAFAPIWELRGSRAQFNSTIKTFAEEHPDYSIRPQRSAELNEAELLRWEEAHPTKCVEAQVDFTFGVAPKGQLIPTTRVVYVPAVREATEAFGQQARSPLAQLVAALVYPRVEESDEFVKLQERLVRDFRKIFPLEGASELADLSSRLTKALTTFVPGAMINLNWSDDEPAVSPPDVVATIAEDGATTSVSHKGHGLQRALIIAMLQAEDEYRRAAEGATPSIHVLFMIEEPELYQHPPRARHFRRVLIDLASRRDGPSRIRVLLTTHSPDFISLETIDSIRIMRRDRASGEVPLRRISAVTLPEVAAKYSAATGKEVDEIALQKRLHIADPVLREAFFANGVVLVEGVGDVGCVSAQCSANGVDLEEKGIVVIPCNGKSNITLPVCVLGLLGIRKYVLFDSDTAEQLEENQALLKAVGAAQIPTAGAPATAVEATYAVLNPDLEAVARREIGDAIYLECTEQTGAAFDVDVSAVMKNPVTARQAINCMRARGARSKTFEAISEKIAGLGSVTEQRPQARRTIQKQRTS